VRALAASGAMRWHHSAVQVVGAHGSSAIGAARYAAAGEVGHAYVRRPRIGWRRADELPYHATQDV